MSYPKNDSEICILGAILSDPSCINYVQKNLASTDFTQKNHRIIYQSLTDIHKEGKPIEPTSLANELKKKNLLDKAGGPQYIGQLADSVAGNASIKYHVEEVKNNAVKRSLNLTLLKGADATKEDKAPQEIIAESESEFDRLKKDYLADKSVYISSDTLLSKEFDKQAQVIGKGILPQGAGLILAGESGVGKSILRTEIAIHLAMGWNLFGLPVNKSWKVLIVQFENPESTEQYRLRQMLKAFQVESLNDNLKFSDPTIRFDLGLKKDRVKALSLVESSQVDVVIWDPLQSLHSVNENDNIQMRSVLDSITQINRKTNTSSIILHHYGKPQEGQDANWRARGASSIRDWADTLIGMTRKSHSSKILNYLTFIKVRNGPEHKPILLQADKQSFTHAVIEEDILGNPQKVAEILDGLGGTVESQVELIDALVNELGCGKRSAINYIKNAVDKTIKEFGEEGSGKRKGYCLFDS